MPAFYARPPVCHPAYPVDPEVRREPRRDRPPVCHPACPERSRRERSEGSLFAVRLCRCRAFALFASRFRPGSPASIGAPRGGEGEMRGKSFRITNFADPHPLSPLESQISEKEGGRGVGPAEDAYFAPLGYRGVSPPDNLKASGSSSLFTSTPLRYTLSTYRGRQTSLEWTT